MKKELTRQLKGMIELLPSDLNSKLSFILSDNYIESLAGLLNKLGTNLHVENLKVDRVNNLITLSTLSFSILINYDVEVVLHKVNYQDLIEPTKFTTGDLLYITDNGKYILERLVDSIVKIIQSEKVMETVIDDMFRNLTLTDTAEIKSKLTNELLFTGIENLSRVKAILENEYVVNVTYSFRIEKKALESRRYELTILITSKDVYDIGGARIIITDINNLVNFVKIENAQSGFDNIDICVTAKR